MGRCIAKVPAGFTLRNHRWPLWLTSTAEPQSCCAWWVRGGGTWSPTRSSSPRGQDPTPRFVPTDSRTHPFLECLGFFLAGETRAASASRGGESRRTAGGHQDVHCTFSLALPRCHPTRSRCVEESVGTEASSAPPAGPRIRSPCRNQRRSAGSPPRLDLLGAPRARCRGGAQGTPPRTDTGTTWPLSRGAVPVPAASADGGFGSARGGKTNFGVQRGGERGECVFCHFIQPGIKPSVGARDGGAPLPPQIKMGVSPSPPGPTEPPPRGPPGAPQAGQLPQGGSRRGWGLWRWGPFSPFFSPFFGGSLSWGGTGSPARCSVPKKWLQAPKASQERGGPHAPPSPRVFWGVGAPSTRGGP